MSVTIFIVQSRTLESQRQECVVPNLDEAKDSQAERVEKVTNAVHASLARLSLACAICAQPIVDVAKLGKSESLIMTAAPGALRGMAIVVPFCADKPECALHGDTLRGLARDMAVRHVDMERAAAHGVRMCNYCLRFQSPDEPKFRICTRCREMHYCSEECQAKSWAAVHSKTCRPKPTQAFTPVTWKTFIITGVDLVKTEATTEAPPAHPPQVYRLWAEIEQVRRRQAASESVTSWKCYCDERPRTTGSGVVCDVVMAIPGHDEVLQLLRPTCGNPVCRDRGDAELIAHARDVRASATELVEDCVVCFKKPLPGKAFKKCGRCRARPYCSLECQRADWPTHKLSCVSEQ
jgi:hypothetical protein